MMSLKKPVVFLLALLASLSPFAQDTLEKNLDEVIIYSSKFASRKMNVAQKIDIISGSRIASMNAQNTGDLLTHTGNVFVQKSQQGGSSPVIRGFEASRVLLVVDGIRMNNAIYRAGHLQNVITVDQNMLDRVEVLYGPASTLYGSDALGGVVMLRTKSPRLSQNDHPATSGSAFTRWSSANNEKTAHIDLSIGNRTFGWLQSYNFSDFDDMKMGDNYPDKYPDYGRRTKYIDHINGIDTIVHNTDDKVQRFSGYRQWDLMQKFLWKPSDRVSHQLNLQHSNSSDIPRYDRLQDLRNGSLRWAEWRYGPQQRNLAAYELTLHHSSSTVFRTIAAVQHIKESRHQREYQRYDRQDNRQEELLVFSINMDGRRQWENHELVTGIDAQLNDVGSKAFRRNLQTGAIQPLDSRYPNGTNRMNYYGVYAQHTYKWGDGRWVLNDGLRLQAVTLRSTIADNSFFRFPFNRITQDNVAITGNLGLIFMPRTGTRAVLGLSSGFRAPNVDDASRIFESGNNTLIVPNPDIRPEYTWNADLGLSQKVGENLTMEATGYFTLFRNAIGLAPFTLNGEDSIFYNGNLVQIMSNSNRNRARIYGLNMTVNYLIVPFLRFTATANYTRGLYETDPTLATVMFVRRGNTYTDSAVFTRSKPLDHIPPFYGRVGISLNRSRVNMDLYALFNGRKHILDMNPDGEDNAVYAAPAGFISRQVVPDGFPGWVTLNLKTAYTFSTHFTFQAGVENIFDRNYRHFASGFSAPGRNVVLAIRAQL